MEYQVPQFIEVEDKLIGPLTFRQFIYIAGAAGLCAVFFAYLPLIFAILFSLLIAGFAAALAFYRMNGKSFVDILEAGFSYYTGDKFFLWKHKNLTAKEESSNSAAAAAASAAAAAQSMRVAPRLTSGKLSELAWSLDVKNPAGSEDDSK